MDQIVLQMNGGAAIVLPQSAARMSTYVLLEQEDWFEKEIGFIRRMLRSGMRVLDVGANFGVYTLSKAKVVGDQGAVWAYEPASATAACLRRSVERNAYAHVTVRQLALSNRQGAAHLRLESNAELNALSPGGTGSSEDVQVTTLDQELEAQAFCIIDFVKLDAEGEETNIVAGGERFFAAQSPLVMFELKHGEVVNTALPDAFRGRGYGLYRLLGPDRFLAPFQLGEPVDAFELNLFACKPDRAKQLADAGLLTERSVQPVVAAGAGLSYWRRQPFAAAFDISDRAVDPRCAASLDQYAAWRNASRPLAERYGALQASFAALKSLAENSDDLATLSTCVRTAIEAGQRNVAVQQLGRMVNLMSGKRPQVDAPFWPASARYEEIAPAMPPADWFAASAIEAFERLRSFSSYFAAPNTLALLEWLCRSPYASAEMERRRQLMRIRAGLQSGIVAAPILASKTAGNLNPDYWCGKA